MRLPTMTHGILALAAGAALVLAAGCAADEDTPGTVGAGTPVGTAVGTAKAAGSTEDVEDDVRAALEAQADGDVDEFLNYWTPRGLQAEFGTTPAEVRERGADEVSTPLDARAFRNTQVNGERATTLVEIGSGEENDDEFVFARNLELIRQGDKWLIDNSTPAAVQAPSGVRTVNVEMTEFAFRFQPTELARGDALINLRNTGTQPHEMVLLRVPDDFNFQEALLSEEEPENVSFLVAAMAQPGQSSSVLVLKDLEAARHVMVCFLPDTADPQGAPHALKGMTADFGIQ